MRGVENNEEYYAQQFQTVRERMTCLLKDENRTDGTKIYSYRTAPHWKLWRTFSVKGKKFYVILTQVWKEILEDSLLERAAEAYPDAFGTDDPEAVIDAICDTMGITMEDRESSLRQSQYFAVIDDEQSKTLCIPLFRIVKDGEFKDSLLHF